MKPKHHSLPPAVAALIAALILWSCSSSVDPQPQATPFSVDTTTGHTTIDTAALRTRMGDHIVHGRDERDIPFMIRLIEIEELGHDAIVAFLNSYDSGIDVLTRIEDEEKSQAAALRIIIHVLGIDHPNPDNELGRYLDEEVTAVWDTYIAAGKHSNSVDALVAVTKVFEFQLKQVIDVRPQLQSRAANYAASIMHGMNANHFRSMYRYLQSADIPYSPSFLTQEEFDEETSVAGYLQLP